MPLIRISTSVPANATAFPLTGSVYETMQYHAHVEFAMNQQSGSLGGVLATVNSGPDTLLEESPISFNARVPLYPDDYELADDVAAGDKLRVQLRNTTGGAIVVVTSLRITPLV